MVCRSGKYHHANAQWVKRRRNYRRTSNVMGSRRMPLYKRSRYLRAASRATAFRLQGLRRTPYWKKFYYGPGGPGYYRARSRFYKNALRYRRR